MEQVSNCITPDDIQNAEAILKVSGVLPDEKCSPPNSVGEKLLRPLGGEKLLRPLGTETEFARVESFNNEWHGRNMQMKVERIGNLAIAEWLPQFQVAKVIKQNKSTSTAMTLNHIEKFLFLFAEEALYLLDSKSIELRLNGTPMSLKDAFSVLTCSSRRNVNNLLCTLDEYYVYAWFMKTGFAVQRHFMPPIVRKPEPKPPEKKDQGCENVEESTNKEDDKNDVKEDQDSAKTPEVSKIKDRPCRGLWNISDCSALQLSVTTQPTVRKNSNLDTTVPKFPDFSGSTPMFIGGLDPKCVLEGMSTKGCVLTVEDRYKVKRNTSTDWKTYKTQLAALKVSQKKENQMKERIINKGKTKPLINSQNDYHSTRQVLQKLDIFEQCSDESLCQGPTFAFNAYKKDKSFSSTFSKKYPGVPFCRVVIANSTSPVLSYNQISQLSSDNVRIKIAVVECGSITFFGIDCVEIPKSVFME